MPLRLLLGLALLAGSIGLALAQDAFEIQVYEYETVPKGMWNLETHLNYTPVGTKHFEGPVAPTNDQLHLTYELTRGITKNFELAGYLVLARVPGDNFLQYAGWRVRPRVSLPKEWHLPMDVSISAEVGFPKNRYEENNTTFELRPILEKSFGRYQLDVNPTITRALRGPGSSDGWEFEPAVRAAYAATKRLDVSLEYYGATGPIREPLPRGEQIHQLFPGGDFKITENLVWNFGLGVGVTPAGNRIVCKMRLGWLFGGSHK